MILRRLAEGFKNQDWFVVLIEIFIVVVGIYIGLQVSAWDDARKDRIREIAALSQLRTGMEEDLVILEEALLRFQKIEARVTVLLDHIKAGKPYTTDLDADFGTLYGTYTQRLNWAAYESLKSEGLGLISDTDLRFQITQIFEKTYTGVELSYQAESGAVIGVLRPYILIHFKDLVFNTSATPVDYQALLDDIEFLNIADYRLQVVRQNNIPVFSRSIEEIKQLIEALGEELG
ncbi:MAG: DUF6090 family protein, partial [Alphaproteobacteria bacterium]